MRYRPWSLDITPDDAGNPPFAFGPIVDPYVKGAELSWTVEDWDPSLRFWALPLDPLLTEWLQSVDASRPSIMAAREFARHHAIWGPELQSGKWFTAGDLDWQQAAGGFARIRTEIIQLQELMQDDRERYLAEAEAQADGLADYVLAFIGATRERHPWTIELVNCGLAIGNVAYMHAKSRFNRVRPSTLCPGLMPPFGPPGHPAFPSGHATLGYLIALLLLEIPAVCARFGHFAQGAGRGAKVTRKDLEVPDCKLDSPLLWLAARLAKNRERLGVHYPSDSSAGRHLAAGLWEALVPGASGSATIACPTLLRVLERARAEWAA